MKISLPQEVARRLKEERERLGWSLLAMAEAGKVGRATQFNYEAGTTHPTVEYIHQLQEAGVDALYVMTGLKAGDLLSATHPDLFWAAIEATLTLKGKLAHLPMTDLGLGLLFIKCFRALENETNALIAAHEQSNPAPMAEIPHE